MSRIESVTVLQQKILLSVNDAGALLRRQSPDSVLTLSKELSTKQQQDLLKALTVFKDFLKGNH